MLDLLPAAHAVQVALLVAALHFPDEFAEVDLADPDQTLRLIERVVPLTAESLECGEIYVR